ncbi:serine hydrolase [Promicromonospora sukumoe]|uniref:Beta-lactamase class A n=1 Tax=Promicromonospora sukumoe TaxID=88382 RepID=A0A7W3J8H7_9MICO|nr:serine hydrolase [Promicromonospora sukumoe]MBA8808144.1 beta-lactamase class A [Promicromonospora sukumoe]
MTAADDVGPGPAVDQTPDLAVNRTAESAAGLTVDPAVGPSAERPAADPAVVATLRGIARDAGVTARVHATRLTGPPGTVAVDDTEPVAVASLYKLPLALVWADFVAAGDLSADQPVRLPAHTRMPGPTGVAMLLDDVLLTARDVVRLMLAVSDNACGDALLALVGRERVHERLAGLGLPETLVRQGSADETRAVMRDTGTDSWAAAQRSLADPDRAAGTTQYDPAFASAATAGQLGRVLRLLWSRPGPAHELVRDALANQAWRHRVGSGFPHDDVVLLGKTGTLGRLRHEAAVVRFPHEHLVGVVVLTRAARPERHLPGVDAAIGELARVAVGPLRLPDDA